MVPGENSRSMVDDADGLLGEVAEFEALVITFELVYQGHGVNIDQEYVLVFAKAEDYAGA